MADPGTDVQVRVRYFAAAAEAAGLEEETLLLPPGATVGDLRADLARRHAGLEAVMRSGSFLVDSVVSRDLSRPVGSRVDVLPPFAGG